MIVKNVIQIKSGITIIVGASGRNIYMQKITFGMLLHKVAKMVNILLTITTNFNEKNQAVKPKTFIFYLPFY